MKGDLQYLTCTRRHLADNLMHPRSHPSEGRDVSLGGCTFMKANLHYLTCTLRHLADNLVHPRLHPS